MIERYVRFLTHIVSSLCFSGAIQDAPPKVMILPHSFSSLLNMLYSALKQNINFFMRNSEFLCYLQPSRPGIQPSFVQIPTSAAQSTFDSSRGVTSPRGGLNDSLLCHLMTALIQSDSVCFRVIYIKKASIWRGNMLGYLSAAVICALSENCELRKRQLTHH